MRNVTRDGDRATVTRPEAVHLVCGDDAEVVAVERDGPVVTVRVRRDNGTELDALAVGVDAPPIGRRVGLRIDPAGVVVVPGWHAAAPDSRPAWPGSTSTAASTGSTTRCAASERPGWCPHARRTRSTRSPRRSRPGDSRPTSSGSGGRVRMGELVVVPWRMPQLADPAWALAAYRQALEVGYPLVYGPPLLFPFAVAGETRWSVELRTDGPNRAGRSSRTARRSTSSTRSVTALVDAFAELIEIGAFERGPEGHILLSDAAERRARDAAARINRCALRRVERPG